MSKAVTYFKDAKKELTKVSWPNWPKVVETSLVVGGCTLVFAVYLYMVDVGISAFFRQFLYN